MTIETDSDFTENLVVFCGMQHFTFESWVRCATHPHNELNNVTTDTATPDPPRIGLGHYLCPRLDELRGGDFTGLIRDLESASQLARQREADFDAIERGLEPLPPDPEHIQVLLRALRKCLENDWQQSAVLCALVLGQQWTLMWLNSVGVFDVCLTGTSSDLGRKKSRDKRTIPQKVKIARAREVSRDVDKLLKKMPPDTPLDDIKREVGGKHGNSVRWVEQQIKLAKDSESS